MKTWYIENAEKITLAESTLTRADHEIKVKMSKVALSSSDIAFFAGEHEGILVPGHSGVAYVSEADDSLGLKLGSRVVVSPFVRYEEHGVTKVCIKGVNDDGLLADFVTLPSENVYALPDGINDDDAIFTEYIALCEKVFASMDYKKGDYIVIVGASTLGFIAAQLAIYYQCVPILVDFDHEKLRLAEQWGVYYTLNPTYDNLERSVEEITGGRMCEFSIFTGEGVLFNNAARLVKENGVVIIAGYSSHTKHQLDSDLVLSKQLTIKGVGNGYGEMSSAINLLANKIIKTDGLITKRVYFEEVPETIAECAKYPLENIQVLVTID